MLNVINKSDLSFAGTKLLIYSLLFSLPFSRLFPLPSLSPSSSWALIVQLLVSYHGQSHLTRLNWEQFPSCLVACLHPCKHLSVLPRGNVQPWHEQGCNNHIYSTFQCGSSFFWQTFIVLVIGALKILA